MHLVTVKDSQTGEQYQYDADLRLATADDGLAFYISQLTNLEAKIYETLYRNIIYPELIPINTSDPEYITTVDYISYDAVTMGKFIAANGRDLPEADIKANKSTIQVGYAGNSYSFSLEELRQSQAMRIPLDATKARMAYRGAQEHMQKVAWFGDATQGMYGLFNNPNVSLDNSLIDWATADGQEIIDDMNGLLIKVWTNSANVHIPNVLVLPSDKFAVISSRRMAVGTDTTILNFFKENNLYTTQTGQPITVKPILELQTAGTSSVHRMMAYELNDDNLTMRMPIPWRSLAPQPDGLRIKVPAEYKFSGVEFRYPGSAGYRDFTS